MTLSIAPSSVHAAVQKGSQYFGVELRLAPLDRATFGVNLREMEALIDSNTVSVSLNKTQLFVSAPDYPFGVIDNVEAVSEMALKYGLNCHVDACMGSYLLPFL